MINWKVYVKGFKPFPEVRAELINHSPDKVFKGAIGDYGKIKNAPLFIAFIGNTNNPFINEMVGYAGEGIILEATSLNLATCWVGGFFRPETAAELAGVRENETVLAVTPVGYAKESLTFEERVMGGFGCHNKRIPLEELVTGMEEQKWPKWLKPVLEAARLAPSAVNRQPWRFHLEPGSITVSVDNLKDTHNISKRLDCGITMLHIEVAARDYGVKGEWAFLEAPVVGRFSFNTLP